MCALPAKHLTFLLPIFVLLAPSLCQETELLELFGYSESAGRSSVYERKEAPRRPSLQYYVSFRRSLIDLHFCAGTLISPRFILTSASCMDPGVSGQHVENATAHIGIYDLEPDTGGRRSRRNRQENANGIELHRTISNVIFHERYSNGTAGRPFYDARYDIALVNLTEPSTQSWVALPLERPDCCDGVDFLNIGFGRSETSGPFAVTLEMAGFGFMPYQECEEALAESQDKTIGAGTRNTSVEMSICVNGEERYCQLDPGSGLVRYMGEDRPPLLIGFANKATMECSYGDPYVFASLSFHMDWILGVDGVLDDISAHEREENIDQTIARISGATTAPTGRFPYAVSVRVRSAVHQCQGALISPSRVLTAASCVAGFHVDIEAYIGGISLDPLDDTGVHERIAVESVISHPRFNDPERDVDLAILVLTEDSEMHPIRLPVQSMASMVEPATAVCILDRDCCPDGTTMRVYGWGSSSASGGFSRELQTGAMMYINRRRCIEEYQCQNLNSRAVCAGDLSTGATLGRGDDGTPLILSGGQGTEDVLIGLGFHDSSQCINGPSQFLRIAFFMSWIRQNVPDLQ